MTISASSASQETTARQRRPVLPLAGISAGYFMVLLDMTVLSVAEPGIARSFHASTAGLQWVVTGYTVAFGSLLLSAGAIADRFGAHRVFRAGVAVFGVTSLTSTFAPDLGVLVALRAVLGVAAAACVPASMALIGRLYPEPARRTRAVAVWAAASGTALAAGPVAGGALIALAGWRTIFAVNVPVAAVTLALSAGRQLRCPPGAAGIDVGAQVLACAALALATDALIAAGGGAGVHAGLSAGGAAVAAAAFALAERRSRFPVLPAAVLRARGIPAALVAGAAVNFAVTGTLFVLPLVFEQRMHLTTVAAGLAFLPMTLPMTVNPLLTGRIVARTGPRGTLLAGLALLTGAGTAFTAVILAGAPYPAYIAGLVCTGLGASFALPTLVMTVTNVAPPGAAGVVGGLLNAARQAGASVGVAATGAFVSSSAAGPGPGAGWAMLLPALACAAPVYAIARPRH